MKITKVIYCLLISLFFQDYRGPPVVHINTIKGLGNFLNLKDSGKKKGAEPCSRFVQILVAINIINLLNSLDF